jgi:hypothetical protein
MAKADESTIEKSAVAVSLGSLTLLALILIADATQKPGVVFDFLGKTGFSQAWGIAAAVPVLTVTYILGITIMLISEIWETFLQRRYEIITKTETATGQYLYKQQAVFDLVGKSDMLLKQFDDIIRYRQIVRGSAIPRFVLGIGLLSEGAAGHYQDLRVLLIVSGIVALFLPGLCSRLLKFLDDALNEISAVALKSFEANLSLSIECDRKPLSLDSNSDLLVIKANLVKGDRGIILLQDAQARVYQKIDEKPWTRCGNSIQFDDIFREEFNVEKSEVSSNSRPSMKLTPGDSMEMSVSCEVTSEKACKVEVVVSSSTPQSFQWRSSRIVYPCSLRLPDRLKPFSTGELRGIVFSLDLAETVVQLVPETARIREELIKELKERDSTASTSKSSSGTSDQSIKCRPYRRSIARSS